MHPTCCELMLAVRVLCIRMLCLRETCASSSFSVDRLFLYCILMRTNAQLSTVVFNVQSLFIFLPSIAPFWSRMCILTTLHT